MIRKSTHSIEEVERIIKDSVIKNINSPNKKSINFLGDDIYITSSRYRLFLTKGYKCVNCGLEGKFFAKEKRNKYETRYHLNLYAIDDNGNEVLMTKDHIIPKSKGGKNTLHNYQTMCKKCNQSKGNNINGIENNDIKLKYYIAYKNSFINIKKNETWDYVVNKTNAKQYYKEDAIKLISNINDNQQVKFPNEYYFVRVDNNNIKVNSIPIKSIDDFVIKKIDYIKNMDGMDNCDVVIVDKNTIVVPKRENFRIGEEVIYIEPRSILPPIKCLDKYVGRNRKVYVKKIRNCISFGVVLKLNMLNQIKEELGGLYNV